jgi:hypothetical protein
VIVTMVDAVLDLRVGNTPDGFVELCTVYRGPAARNIRIYDFMRPL